MSTRVSAALVLVTATCAYGEVVSYEADLLPVDDGWDIQQNFCDTQEWIDGGVFFQRVETCPGTDPEEGQQSSYIRSTSQFLGSTGFFIEWRMRTSGDRSEIPFGGPATLSAGSNCASGYTFFIADDQVKLNRGNLNPLIFADLTPGVFHTFRLGLVNEGPLGTYELWIDGVLIDGGEAAGVYPCPLNPRLSFRAKKIFEDSTAEWDYIRWGDTPVDGSGDFTSDSLVDQDDLPFFLECLGNSGPGVDAGPGCRWADMDSDTDVDCDDWEAFKLEWDDPTPPTPIIPCDIAIPAMSQWTLVVMTLLLLVGGTIVFRYRHGVSSSGLGDPP